MKGQSCFRAKWQTTQQFTLQEFEMPKNRFRREKKRKDQRKKGEKEEGGKEEGDKKPFRKCQLTRTPDLKEAKNAEKLHKLCAG